MNSVRALASWQAAVLATATSVSFLKWIHGQDDGLSALIVLGLTFGIALISALVAAINKSHTALYIMTASLVTFAAVFSILATELYAGLFCIAVGFCLGKTAIESNLKMIWVILVALIGYSGAYWGCKLGYNLGPIVTYSCLIALMIFAYFANDQKALKPAPPA